MSGHRARKGLEKPILLFAVAIVFGCKVVRAENRQWLLGNWNGKRQALAEEGFELDFVLTLEGVQNVDGGIARSTRALANLDLIMDARGEALGLLENGDLHLHVVGQLRRYAY
ncbi:MAG: hypothetical protein JSW59_12555 [Phycisphaerales bacterium]|nr:MAG: hypothetical protein JSW59_12555 [Phycisphaerales bacterium]